MLVGRMRLRASAFLSRVRSVGGVHAAVAAPVVAGNMFWQFKTVTAAFTAMDGCALLYLASTGKYWRYGGWDNTVGRPTTNEVWSSPDLVTWTLELAYVAEPPISGAGARFRPRHFFGNFLHTHAGTQYMYVVGGDHVDSTYFGFPAGISKGYAADVWRSSNGTTWERVCASDDSPWAGVMFTVSGSFGGAIYVFGGQDGILAEADTTIHNWCFKSTDGGATWATQAADRAPSATVPQLCGIVSRLLSFNGRLWLLGGGTYTTTEFPVRLYYNKVWSTLDGATWTEHTAAPWAAREYHAVEVYGGRMWLGSGYNGANRHDVWSTADGETWFSHGTAPWHASHADAFAAGPNGLAFAMNNGAFTDLVKSCYLMKETPWVPDASLDVSNVAMWYEASRVSTDGTTVFQWPDVSGNNRHLNSRDTGGVSLYDPLYFATDALFNSKPTLGTSAAADQSKNLYTTGDQPTFSIAGPHTVYNVHHVFAGRAAQIVYWQFGLAGAAVACTQMAWPGTDDDKLTDGTEIGNLTMSPGVTYVTCGVYSTGGLSAGYVNSVTAAFSGTSAAGVALAGFTTGTMAGEASRYRQSEKIIVAGIHTLAQRTAWMTYLANKYGVTLT